MSDEYTPALSSKPPSDRSIPFSFASCHHVSSLCLKSVVFPDCATFAPYAWAASVMAAVLLTWMVNKPMQNQQIQLTAVEVIKQQYQTEKNTMLVSFGKPDISKLPEKMQKQFTELQSARESLLMALEDDPENPDLLNLLKWTQSQELSLLEQLYSPKWQTI